MAYYDSTPERLMPAPLALRRELSREMSAAAAPADPVAPSVNRRHRLETVALAAIVALFAGLVFTLAIRAIGTVGISLVVTTMILLPIVSFGVIPSGKGR